jgi:hypothetical protein
LCRWTTTTEVEQSEQHDEHDEEQDAPVSQVESSSRRRPKWVERTLREAQEQVDAPRTSVRQSKPPERFSSYMALMSELIEVEPSNFRRHLSSMCGEMP